MARECAKAYVRQREELGFPMLKDPEERAKLGLDEKEAK